MSESRFTWGSRFYFTNNPATTYPRRITITPQALKLIKELDIEKALLEKVKEIGKACNFHQVYISKRYGALGLDFLRFKDAKDVEE
jgi:hypothetical protein